MVCVLQGMVCSVPELKYVVITIAYGVQYTTSSYIDCMYNRSSGISYKTTLCIYVLSVSIVYNLY